MRIEGKVSGRLHEKARELKSFFGNAHGMIDDATANKEKLFSTRYFPWIS